MSPTLKSVTQFSNKDDDANIIVDHPIPVIRRACKLALNISKSTIKYTNIY